MANQDHAPLAGQILVNAASNVLSPGVNVHAIWVTSVQCVNSNLDARIGLLIVADIFRYLFDNRISQRLQATGIATRGAMEENKVQLLDLKGAFRS